MLSKEITTIFIITLTAHWFVSQIDWVIMWVDQSIYCSSKACGLVSLQNASIPPLNYSIKLGYL